ncbi:hypothetical protein PR048_001591 [Dryococelus australis]|uniref:Mutator-like transposase domain-containing protein n=1 Tax=Dryococelus australis TaxID=614101 RepID=A0ABQ9IHT1_9NEOP|nr:hypothetical protein PR048_001591 [Dryococelus australis]
MVLRSGLRFKYFLGDGDSCVYARLMENVHYGRQIQKKKKNECANHRVRNYTDHLHQLATDKNFSIAKQKNSEIGDSATHWETRGAIKHCAVNNESHQELARDLKNCPTMCLESMKTAEITFAEKLTEITDYQC